MQETIHSLDRSRCSAASVLADLSKPSLADDCTYIEDPPEAALVLSAEEKSKIQALDRLAPAGRPHRPLPRPRRRLLRSRIDKDRKTRNHVRQFRALGYSVTLTPAA